MVKCRLLMVVVCFLILWGVVPAEAEKPIAIRVNQEAITGGVSPVILHNQVLIPARQVFSALGADVLYQQKDRKIRITRGEVRIDLQMEVPQARVNQQVVKLALPPRVVSGRTMVPLRFVAEALGTAVQWNQATKEINISWPRDGWVREEISAPPDNSSLTWVAGKERLIPRDGKSFYVLTGSGLRLMEGTGSVIWEVPVPENDSNCEVTAWGDRTLILNPSGLLSAATGAGKIDWQVRSGKNVSAGITAVQGGLIYLSDGKEVAAVTGGGEISWVFKAPGTIVDKPAAAPDGGLYLGTGSGIYALTPQGAVRWVKKQDYVQGLALQPDGTLEVGTGSGALILDSQGHEATRFHLSLDGTLEGPLVPGGNQLSSIGKLKKDKAGNTYVFTRWTNDLCAYDPQGKMIWSYHCPEGCEPPVPLFQPSMGEKGPVYLYMAAPTAKLVALDQAGGKERWTYLQEGERNIEGQFSLLADNTVAFMAGSYLAVFNPQGECLYRFAGQSSFGELLGTGPEGQALVRSGSGHGLTLYNNKGVKEWSWDGETPLNGFFVDVTQDLILIRYQEELAVLGWDGQEKWHYRDPRIGQIGVDLGGDSVVLFQFQGPNRIEKIVSPGKAKWSVDAEQGETFRTAIDSTGQFYLARQQSGKVLALDAEGKTLWEEELDPGSFVEGLFPSDSGVYVNYHQGTRWTVLLLDKNGREIWRQDCPEKIWDVIPTSTRNKVYLIVGGDQPVGIMIADAKGEKVFSQETPEFHIWKLGLDDRLLFSIDSEKGLSGLMALTPEGTLQQLASDSYVDGYPFSLADGTVFFGQRGKLMIVDHQGIKQREMPLGYEVRRIVKAGEQTLWLQVSGKSGDMLLLFSPDTH